MAIDACDTLRILHLPPRLSDERRDELFKKYGAIKTKTLRPSQKYTMTFAKFSTHSAATEALLRLHQLRVRGQYLSVDFAKISVPTETLDNEAHCKETKSDEPKKETVSKAHFQAFLQRLNGWTANYTFTQPPPPNISYKYPPPTKSTLLRIAIQLIKEPIFYTQVLHLMNRLNLPPPFEELDLEYPILKETYDVEKYQDIFGKVITDYTDEENESEIESDGDNIVRPAEVIPTKRKRPQCTNRLKIRKFVNPVKQSTVPSAQKAIRQEDMFEPVQRGESKNLKIELKTVDKLLDLTTREQNDGSVNSTGNATSSEGGFGLMFPVKNVESDESENAQRREFITSEELADNRISANDQRVLPVFKNYHPGKPSSRLYIKNLAKQVETSDLHYIFRRYVVPGLKNTEHEYDVRLMQEGRMKGQAFVTLQNVMQARLALDETNGYILKDKPMVVQFAKVKS